eukprot:12428941-Karenia_brevis.AAC.1
MRGKKFSEFDVPGDGACFLYSEMLFQTEMYVEWSTQERFQNGVAKCPARCMKEKETLFEAIKFYMFTTSVSVHLFVPARPSVTANSPKHI